MISLYLMSLDDLHEFWHERAHGGVDEDAGKSPGLAVSQLLVDAHEQLDASVDP